MRKTKQSGINALAATWSLALTHFLICKTLLCKPCVLGQQHLKNTRQAKSTRQGERKSFCILSLLLATFAGTSLCSGLAAANTLSEQVFELSSKSHIVRAGDTLQSIARDEYGSVGFWRQIAEYNQLKARIPLQVGGILKLPIFQKRLREYASVVFSKGQVELLTSFDDTRSDMKVSDKVYLNDLITTGEKGFASLLFLSGTVVNIQPYSTVKLVTLHCLEHDDVCVLGMDASKGGVASDVKHTEKQPTEFTITTPYASAAVRGTKFDFEANATNVLVGVTDGAVDVITTGKISSLPIGFGAVTKPGAGTGPSIELTGPPTYRGLPPRFAAGDKISWWRVPQSTGYIVSLANDEIAQSIITQNLQKNRIYNIAPVPAGEYFINVRPVDKNGLKGFGTSQKINIVAIDKEMEGLAVSAQRQGSEMLIKVIEPLAAAEGYEIQLSPDARFDDVISIDVGQSGSAVFRNPEQDTYVRARALINPQRVSSFGPAIKVN